ncbi:hypothetical protein SCHPADRAFT_840704, partial [Schizopora paradoxa]
MSISIPNQDFTQCISYKAATTYTAISVIGADDIEELRKKQEKDEYFGKIIQTFRTDDKACYQYPQYYVADNGLCYFEDSIGGTRLCVPECNRIAIMTEAHDGLTETGHAG